MKKFNNVITVLGYLFISCTSFAYADAPQWIDEQAIIPLVTVLVLAAISLIIVGLLLYGCVRNISAKEAFVASCVDNAIVACISIPLIRFAHLGWLNTFFKFNEAPFQAFSLWVLLYLASSFIAVFFIHTLFRYPLKQLLIPLFVGNFIIFILIINAYVFVSLIGLNLKLMYLLERLRVFNTLSV